jgi:hypothetical protein
MFNYSRHLTPENGAVLVTFPDVPTVRSSALEGIKLAVYREMTIQLYKA